MGYNFFDNIRKSVVWYPFCFLLALTAELTRIFDVSSYYPGKLSAGLQIHWGKLLLVSILLNIIVPLFARAIQSFHSKTEVQSFFIRTSPRKFLIGCAVLLCIFWIPFYIAFFPGTVMQDEIFAMRNPMGIANQPLIYNLLLEWFWHLGISFHHPTWGLGLFNFIQMLLQAFGISYCLLWSRKRISQNLLVGEIIYFLILPIIANIATTLIKDRIFSVLLLIGIPIFYNAVAYLETNGSEKIHGKITPIGVLCIWSVPVMLFRSNGPYIWLGALFIIGVKYRRKAAKFLVYGIATFLLCSIPKNFVETPFQEVIGVPLQQVSYIFNNHRNLSKEDRAYFNTLLPIKYWESIYRPDSPDNIKYHKEFQRRKLGENKSEFMRHWMHVVYKDPKSAVEAWLFNTYGFWSFTSFPWPRSQSTMSCAATNDILTIKDPNGHVNGRFVTGSNNPLLRRLALFNVRFTRYIGAGICFWVVFFVFYACMVSKRTIKAMALLPILLCWGTLMASAPSTFAFRYTYMYPLALPFVLNFLSPDTELPVRHFDQL
ncbi:MAG: hypothetical protein ACFWT7_00255 [Succiniclasticum sp.]|jgi:hypothetical protein